jgi:hypothetical protein
MVTGALSQMRDGNKFLHESPKYGFKREYQRPAPSTNLSASTFITERHAKTANHSIHSPGPIYYPAKPELHKRTRPPARPAQRTPPHVPLYIYYRASF